MCTASRGPPRAVHIARDLYGLLHAANVLPPYVLVGHSFGGLYVRAYAAALPTDVAGLVLLEASHPDQFQRSQQARTEYAELRTMYTVLPWAARLGGLRVSPSCRAPVSFPATAARELHAACAAAAGWTTQQAEFDAIDATMAQVRAAKLRPGLALVVVSGGAHVAASADWGVLQHELGLLSARSSFRIVPGGTHTSLWQDPAQAATCAAAILSVALGPSPSIQNPITENSP